MRYLFTALLFCTAFHQPALSDEPQVKPIKVLLVCGGCCHDYAAQKELLSKGMAERAHMDFTVVHQGGSATDSRIPLYENPDWAKGYDVVIHDECFADVKDPAWLERILKPHREGVPGVVLHCAMHCYRTGSDEWFKFCGVTSRKHGAAYPHEVLTRDGEHPIMKTLGAGWANPAGELYWIEQLWPTAHPLASAKNRETGADEVCVWTNEYGKARVFGSTLGHHNETVSHPAFLDTITRGTLWACDKLNDDYLKPVVARRVPKNLALDRPVTASSEETPKSNFARHAVDGNMKTRWCAATGNSPEWLQVELQKPEKITGVALEWEGPQAIYRYQIEVSDDAKTWQKVVDLSKSGEVGSKTHALDGVTARYVRVTYFGSNTGAWGSIRELQVQGEELVEVQSSSAGNAAEKAILNEVKVPDGFETTVFATPPAVNYPVFVATSPEGDVYVSSDKNGSLGRDPHYGSVIRLRDLDGDGRADESKRFVADVDSPRGLVWDHDRLYVLHPPDLSAFIDHNQDGIADEQKVLVKGIAFNLKDRPADHTSNGVTMGIDGWLYLAIGDFGFMEAVGADGTKLQLRGGGVVRVRPDGTGLEVYSRGTRNILEVGVDPLLNGFTRDNTNDGGGWDIRLHHFSGLDQHGYPTLFKNFGDEVVQPLADYGGGSGCGTLYMDEPGFPEGFGNAMYTADWGRERVFRHRMTPKGATFVPDREEFLTLPRVTDLDVDAHGHIYAASWKGATFNYAGENVGYLVRVSPKGASGEKLANVAQASVPELIELLQSASHRRRLAAQREIVRRGLAGEPAVKAIAQDRNQPVPVRVAAIFCLKQGLKEKANPLLAELVVDAAVREWAIRALADDRKSLAGVPAEGLTRALADENPRVRLQAAIALARLVDAQHAPRLLALLGDADPIVAHTSATALVDLGNHVACFAELDRADSAAVVWNGAVRVLARMHKGEVVSGLAERLAKEADASRRLALFTALCRLHFVEGKWKGNSWGTRPDTRGPYYQPEAWSETGRIATALQATLAATNSEETGELLKALHRHRIELEGGIEKMIVAAANDPALAATTVAQIATRKEVPASASELLSKVCREEATPPDVRRDAIIAISRTSHPDCWRIALASLAKLSPNLPISTECREARDRLFASPQIGVMHEVLEKAATQPSLPECAWANAALLAASNSKGISPEAKAAVTQSLEKGWNDPTQKPALILAVGLAENRNESERVLMALEDSDPKIRQVAELVVRQLNLKPAVTGPLLESMPVEEVIKSVLGTKGDRSRGEQLFTQLSCVKCHTVRPEEQQKGPFLGNIASTYKRRELAESVLLPSKTIAQGFATNAFVLDDGTQLAGFVTLEAADKVTIRDIEAREHVIPVDQIEQRAKQTISMMPDGLVKKISVPDFTSLIDYLESLVKK